jgi:NADPH-dependent 2,4-dienoyl-CoA reductase/sulfur reductase-like enzyme
MKPQYDIAVIGAGPAGMAAAATAAGHGASVLLVDEQGSPGGQIYRAITRQNLKDQTILGPEYYAGRELATEFEASGIEYCPSTAVWQVSQEREIGISAHGTANILKADQVIIATGAQERPFPVPGWTLPGVMGAGAAQVLLKSGGVTLPDAVFVGTGPLLYLVAHQYLRAGIPIKAILDTTPQGNTLRALAHIPSALGDLASLFKGRRWISQLRAAGIPFIKQVEDIRCTGTDAVEAIEYRQGSQWIRIDTQNVLLHQGVVPNVNLAMATGCDHIWNDAQLCWHAKTDGWSHSSIDGIFVTGDGAGINGAKSAEHSGRLAALGALHRCGLIDTARRDRLATPVRRALTRETRIRPFLDALFRPAQNFRVPADNQTIVCRCEEVTAGAIREAVDLGCLGPNQLKSFTRTGMGPCQARMCGLTALEIIANSRNVNPSDVGAMRLRSPVKPLLLGELADLAISPTKTSPKAN